MRISISTGTLFVFPPEKIFEMAKEVGFDGIEVVINRDFGSIAARRLIKQLARTMPVLSIHAPFMPLDGWGGPIDGLKRCVEIASECGAKLVNFHPPSWAGFEFGYWRWLYKIKDFQKEIGGDQVKVTLENMPWTGKYLINAYILSETQKMIDFLKSRNLYMTFDCTHMGSGRANFINDFYLYYNSGRIRNIHFSDYGHGRQHLLPGRGILPLTRFLNHLRNTSYDETVTLELSPYEFPKGEQIIIESLKEILSYLRAETAKTTP